MCNHQIPPIAQHVTYITLVVRPWRFGRQQVARHGIVSGSDKGIPHRAAELAGNKDSHAAPIPPSTAMMLPVTHLLASDSRNTAACAMSSHVPKPSGCLAA